MKPLMAHYSSDFLYGAFTITAANRDTAFLLNVFGILFIDCE